jgi:pimeloyl-ACP methyl ester carboxylesterase
VSERGRRGLVAGGVVGAVAAGIAAGVALERLAIGRQRLRPDPEAREPFGRLPGRTREVVADDGVRLHVEEVGDGEPTVVFVHGFALAQAAWHYQRRDLGDAGRLVFYDHRSHGQSQRAPDDTHTLEQLGRDLAAVLDAVAPRGPVVLVGHSMGGMTVMALAEHRPELFGDRVVGVVLVGTSATNMAELLVPVPIRATGVATAKVLPTVHRIAGRRAALIERSRRIGSDFGFVVTRRWGFGDDPSPAQVELVERLTSATPVDVLTSFASTFTERDRYDALPVVGRVPVLVIVGDKDRITPLRAARDIAARTPGAELVVLTGAGHMVMTERAPLVNLHLRAFLRRVGRGARARRGA